MWLNYSAGLVHRSWLVNMVHVCRDYGTMGLKENNIALHERSRWAAALSVGSRLLIKIPVCSARCPVLSHLNVNEEWLFPSRYGSKKEAPIEERFWRTRAKRATRHGAHRSPANLHHGLLGRPRRSRGGLMKSCTCRCRCTLLWCSTPPPPHDLIRWWVLSRDGGMLADEAYF